MDDSNAEIFRRSLEHVNETGEFDPGLFSHDVVWRTRSDDPAGSVTYRGLEGLSRGMAAFREVWAQLRGEVTNVTERGDAVAGTIRWSVRGHGGVELEVTETWVSWFRDGKISRIEQHSTGAEAVEAMRNIDTQRRDPLAGHPVIDLPRTRDRVDRPAASTPEADERGPGNAGTSSLSAHRNHRALCVCVDRRWMRR